MNLHKFNKTQTTSDESSKHVNYFVINVTNMGDESPNMTSEFVDAFSNHVLKPRSGGGVGKQTILRESDSM